MGRAFSHVAQVLAMLIVGAAVVGLVAAQQCSVPSSQRIDCMPHASSVNQQDCQRLQCCWGPSFEATERPANLTDGEPWCFFAANQGYNVVSWVQTNTGYAGTLQMGSLPGPFGNDIQTLNVLVDFDSNHRLHFKITDANHARWEVPNIVQTSKPSSAASNPAYAVSYTGAPFGLSVMRQSTGHVLLNSTLGGLVFEDMFLQISFQLPSNSPMYGLGEHVKPFLLNNNYYTYTEFARDRGTPVGGINLYGSHPFYLRLESDGKANGVFLLNSNALDIVLSPTTITYRALGGVLDFYVLLGDSPEAVIQEYHTLIGFPILPSYWSLGFHLCRWGYNSAQNTWDVVKKMRAGNFPQDSQWNDIDYMNAHLDFTLDPQSYPQSIMQAMVNDLHAHGQHYVPITDVGISSTQPKGTYPAWEEGVQLNVFVGSNGGGYEIGSVWPGLTTFPDFTHPSATKYWYDQLSLFHQMVPFDGLWIDMNEPSSFTTPACPNEPNPPYLPGDGHPLNEKTICMSSTQYLSEHYNVHNLYGYSETTSTRHAMEQLLGTRTLVIPRSTFANSGAHGGHWLGDNNANFDDMYYSIPGILDMNMFGIPLVGADICGFGGDTTEELCTRWMQLGSFYPFSRNHNTLNAKPQEPFVFSTQAQNAMRFALNTRYSLLPYLYTQFYRVHTVGGTVARSLCFQFPAACATSETVMQSIDRQFMFGPALMVSPVLTGGASNVQAYFPVSQWYDFYTGHGIVVSSTGAYQTLYNPLYNPIPLHIRGGSVIPMQGPALTTTAARQNPMELVAAPGVDGNGSGDLYWDDGISLNTVSQGQYTYVQFTLNTTPQSGSSGSITSNVVTDAYPGAASLQFTSVVVLGTWRFNPSSGQVRVNGAPWSSWNFDANAGKLTLQGLQIPIDSVFRIDWSSSSSSSSHLRGQE